MRRIVIFSCLALSFLVTDRAHGSGERCRTAVAEAAAKLAAHHAQALARCQDRVLAGTLPAETDCTVETETAVRLAKAERALHKKIAKACGGRDKTCGTGDDTSLAAAGWTDAVCPAVLGSPCGMRMDHCGDLAECVVCSARAATSDAVAFATADVQRSSSAPATRKCQRATVKATARHFAARTSALQKCIARAAAGDPAAACIAPHDPKTAAALAKADTQTTKAICRACGGSDKRCDGATTLVAGSSGGDDPGAADLGLPAFCPEVTAPGEPGGCAGDVASLAEAVDCLACTTRYRADCIALAADASAHPLPAACTKAAACDPGYTGPTCTDLLPEVVSELAKLPDPQGWLTDGESGARYRRATRRERVRYGWLPGTYLVEAPQVRADATAGKSTVELALPTADDDVHPVLFDLASAERGEQMIEVRGDVAGKARAKADFPLFLNYLSRTKLETSFEALVRVVAVENGGASVRGMVGTRWLEGYLPTGTLELDPVLITPNSPHPGQLLVIGVRHPDAGTAAGWGDCHGEGICGAYCSVQAIEAPCSADVYNPCCEPYDPEGQPSDDCHDGFDNDFDGKIDENGSPFDSGCRHSQYCVPNGTLPAHTHTREAGKQFILLGEIHLCSYLADQLKDWRAEMHVRAQHIVHGYEQETGYDPYHYLTEHRMGLRFVTAKCWILDDLEQARECKDGTLADCDPFDAAPHVYPYAGAGNTSGNYLFDMPRADMAHAVEVGLWQPVNLVQVLMATGKGEQLIGGSSPNVAGRAEGAYSVSKYTDTFAHENFNVSNHEFGHSLGFNHCDAELSPIDNVCTIMGDDHNTTGSCQLSSICNVPDGHARLSPGNAESLYGTLRNGAVLPFHFGNAP